MKRCLLFLLMASIALSTEPIDLRWETRNVGFDFKKLFGFPRSLYFEEPAQSAHLFRLAQSIVNYLGLKLKCKIEIESRWGQWSDLGLWIEYGKKRQRVPETKEGLYTDLSFIKALLSVLGKEIKAEKLLKALPDKSAPILSLKNDIIAYKMWLDGKEVVVVQDWNGNILWEWGIKQGEGYLPVDPLLSPEGNIVSFLVRDKLYIKDLFNNSFRKISFPVLHPHLNEMDFFDYDNPIFYPSEKYILYGTTYANIHRGFDEQEINLFFTDGKRIVYSSRLGIISDILNFLWSPDQEKLAILFEKWNGWKKYHQELLVIDVGKRKTMKFKLLPAHYSFIWDKDSDGIYLATKGKIKGEIFYLSLEKGKISRLYKCGTALQIFNLQEDGTLVLRKGESKLLLYKNGEEPQEIPARFRKYMLNQSAESGPCNCWGWGGLGCFDLAGPFPTNCVEIAIADGISPQKNEIFVYPHNTQGERVLLRKLILTPQIYEE